MDYLTEQISDRINEASLLPEGARVVVAVSGGLDSMALLHLLSELAPKNNWTITVAHFNHGLRGKESDADERLVKQTARSFGLQCRTGRAKATTLRGAKKKSLEMACRDARHEFLAKVARAANAAHVALAHHADDQTELFWLRLLRGSGNGLAGMEMDSPSPADLELRLIRPLLEVSRTELAAFVERNAIHFREDASNDSRDHERNRVRHDLIPFVDQTFARNVDGAIRKTQRIVAANADFAEESARIWLRAKRRKAFGNLHSAVQRDCLRLQLIEKKIEPSFELIEKLRISPESWVSVSPSRQIARSADGRIRQRKSQSDSFSTLERRIQLRGERGSLEFGGRWVEWSRESAEGIGSKPRKRRHAEVFDAGKVGRRLILRHWKPGDRFQPIGMKTAIKLQDMFVNQKIPRNKRRGLLVATTAKGDIFWVEGCRIGEMFKLTENTRQRLNWTWKNASNPT